MVDRVQTLQPAPRTRRLLLRLCLFAFCGGLLLLLSSRPAHAAERQEPGLLDPVRTTLKATAREVDSFAGRATGSGSSTVGKAADAARRVAAPRPRPAIGAAPPATSTVRRGAPAVTSPVRRATPSPRPATSATRTATRSVHTAAKPVTSSSTRRLEPVTKLAAKPAARATKAATGPLGRVATGLCGPVDGHGKLARRCATLPLRGAEPGPGSVTGGRILEPVVGLTESVLRPVGPALASVGSALAPVGSVLVPVGSALAPVGAVLAPVGGLVPPVVPGGLLPVPGLGGSGAGVPAATAVPAQAGGSGADVPAAAFEGLEGAAPADLLSSSQTNPARPAADGASTPAARSIRSWPALTGAVSLPGSPASAELPAGGPDPLSSSSGARLGLAGLTAALLLLGPSGRGRARPDRSGVISRSYLPLVSPA